MSAHTKQFVKVFTIRWLFSIIHHNESRRRDRQRCICTVSCFNCRQQKNG